MPRMVLKGQRSDMVRIPFTVEAFAGAIREYLAEGDVL